MKEKKTVICLHNRIDSHNPSWGTLQIQIEVSGVLLSNASIFYTNTSQRDTCLEKLRLQAQKIAEATGFEVVEKEGNQKSNPL